MKQTKLEISGVIKYEFQEFFDERGSFLEWFKIPNFEVKQANKSVSREGTIRGIHFALTPPGQAKYVTCITGSVIDVMVDLRKGSPTFKKWISVELTATNNTALLIPSGIGHGFSAVEESSTVIYLCDQPYNAANERAINPYDQSIGVDWPKFEKTFISEKDLMAPNLDELLTELPEFIPE